MNWHPLTTPHELAAVAERSRVVPCLIFKHSTRCPISTMAKKRLEMNWDDDAGIEPYFVDLIQFRDISNGVAEEFGVRHESPQALLIANDTCVYDASHLDIRLADMREALAAV